MNNLNQKLDAAWERWNASQPYRYSKNGIEFRAFKGGFLALHEAYAELLDAAEFGLERLLIEGHPIGGETEKAVDKLRTAIAKAKGET